MHSTQHRRSSISIILAVTRANHGHVLLCEILKLATLLFFSGYKQINNIDTVYFTRRIKEVSQYLKRKRKGEENMQLCRCVDVADCNYQIFPKANANTVYQYKIPIIERIMERVSQDFQVMNPNRTMMSTISMVMSTNRYILNGKS